MNTALEAFEKLDEWLELHGWTGYDPYDIKSLKFFRWLEENRNKIFLSHLNLIFTILSELFPILTRKFFRVRPQTNAKALALLARAYIKAHNIFKSRIYLEKALKAINLLMQNKHSSNPKWLCWGYPFDWQSLVLIPKNTPLVVVSALGGHAFLDMYELSSDTDWLLNAQKVKNFLLNGLNLTEYNDGTLSFSYSPIDTFKVINATLYAAAFLARFGKLSNDRQSIEISRKARRFALMHQRADGAWEYWADRPSIVDAYHHGIILEWLYVSTRYDNPLANEREALSKGLAFYIRKFIGPHGECKFTDGSTHPIDIHSVAQCIVTLSLLLPCEQLNILDKVLYFALKKMRNRDGSFIYRILKFNLKSKIPFIRWGQAWMLWALANYIEKVIRCAAF